MRKTRVKRLREAYHARSGFTDFQRDNPVYKSGWRKFKKSVRGGK
jgi:hypothetical protein